ncbi:hypothetical protein, partial [Klebsiella pneumoniae]|uniref:hypothetical protein n=1 Tax=Klebsiella pneumoniae TaxID=573 RepID=UPI00272EE9E1
GYEFLWAKGVLFFTFLENVSLMWVVSGLRRLRMVSGSILVERGGGSGLRGGLGKCATTFR